MPEADEDGVAGEIAAASCVVVTSDATVVTRPKDDIVRDPTSFVATAAAGPCASSVASVQPQLPVIREGLAEVLPNAKTVSDDGKADVFYNPAQVFNRDLSVVVLSVFAKLHASEIEERRKKREQRRQERGREPRPPPPGLKILEALAATGIRSIRYVKELGEGPHGIRGIVANDLDPTAAAHIRRNLEHNGISENLIEVTCDDANRHMHSRRARGINGLGDDAYDVIDLDPYGTCSPFIEAAIQAIGDGGLLCVTSTDMPILGGNHPETSFARYGGSALKSSYVHEMSLRLVLHAIATTAAKYGREAQPLMSVSIDFYVRIFVRIWASPARAKHHASKTGVVHQCVQCESFFVQPFGEIETPKENTVKFKPARAVAPGPDCPECNGRMKLGGPFYIGNLHHKEFVQQVLEACSDHRTPDLPGVTSWKKVKGLATAISEEHPDLPLHYKLPHLCKSLKVVPCPLKKFRGTLMSLGYRVSHFHREPEAVKTDAPNKVIFDLMRLWCEENVPKSVPFPGLMQKELTLKRPFEWTTEVTDESKAKVPRFLPNPEKNWGPKPRARGGGDEPRSVVPQPTETLAARNVYLDEAAPSPPPETESAMEQAEVMAETTA
eukprot:TRINITY_DN8784_c0_g1_i1.p1 TRINITY_DN8784_c0_g1~~TRINITY_DN8784_c0_g1_i1.p1  ORF type:complete len:611 (-),score=100.53 TRINITY_DN8784_c0_g1_i1:207-2039(-)